MASIRTKAFTLIELLIVVGVLAMIAAILVLILNPIQFLAQGRDSRRLSDLKTITSSISLAKTQVGLIDSTTSNIVYLSLPDVNGNLSDNCIVDYPSLPALSGIWQYRCQANATNLRKVDNTGWLPIDFTSVSNKPINILPIDPTNNSNYFYSYTRNGLATPLESDKYIAQTAAKDGGTQSGYYETTPISWIGTGGGPALLFDGVNDYVQVNDNPTLDVANEISIEFWFRPDHITMPPGPYINSSVVDKLDFGADAGWAVYYDNDEDYWISQGYTGGGGLIQLYIQDVGAVGETVLPGSVYHVIGTFNKNAAPFRLKFYVNGSLVSNVAGTNAVIKDVAKHIYIGADPVGGMDSFQGAMYKIRLYSRALGDTEVNEHYQGIFNNNTGLIGKWNFDEGSGATATDSSGTGNNGSLKPLCPNCPQWITL